MTNLEFIDKLNLALKSKTLYVNGAFGAPADYGSNRTKYINNYKKNQSIDRKNAILHSADDTFFFDCICLGKGILWGWNADLNKLYGGAAYTNNGIPDFSIQQLPTLMTKYAPIKADDEEYDIGEWLWNDHHVGYYVGDGYYIECTYGNNYTIDGVQKNRLNKSNFTHHGRIQYLEYVASQASSMTLLCPHCGKPLALVKV